MSRPTDGYAARLGQPADWGLNADSFAPLRDELADHLRCLSLEGGKGGLPVDVDKVATKLATPESRRALTATRIADQVYATLHRWPTKQEWREFAWLLLWFAVILLSDWIAHLYNNMLGLVPEYRVQIASHIQLQAYLAWLLQGIARAGFFTLFAATLWHAWKIGKGVILARILQLKLIHTLLVVGAFYSVGSKVSSYYNQLADWQSSEPTHLIGPVVSAILLGLGLVLWIVVRPQWQAALSLILLAVFLYSGGPVNYQVLQVTKPILSKRQLRRKDVAIVEGKPIITIPDERIVLQNFAAKMKEGPNWNRVKDKYDFEKNLQTYQTPRLPLIFGNIYSTREFAERRMYRRYDRRLPEGWTEQVVAVRSTTPMSFGGAGLGWLAAPIPFLGIVGLIGLLVLMGRRSLVSLVVYAALCFVAIVSTVLPFFFVQQLGKVMWLNADGMVVGPFPGFDSLFIGGSMGEDWMLVLGLGISAVIPWLLTALFLKPTNSPQRNSGPEVAA